MQSNEQQQNPNMELWGSVFTTNRHEVKPITGKSYRGDSPKPYYLIQKATEVFGPCGIGWGYKVVDHGFNEFAYNETLPNGTVVARKKINHWALVEFWYKWKGEKSEGIQQFGGTQAAYISSKNKAEFDEDVTKKSVTDALIKCMSCVGFAGDIFSGRWDDSKYHQEQQERQQQQNQRQQQQRQQQAANNNQQQPAQQPVQATNAAQLTPEKQEATKQKALAKINGTNDPQDLNAALAFFAGTQHEQIIRNACDAKADREGWSA